MKRRQFLSATAASVAGWLAAQHAQAKQPENDSPPTPANEQPTEAEQTESPREITWSRKVPVRYQADVAVIGGGIAGVCAAAAAARSGAKVILVERFAVTGGMLTSGGVSNFCDESQVRQPLGEVFTEIVADLDAWGAIGHGKSSVFHYETMAVILQELLLRRGVKLLLHTRFVDARVDQGRITECIVCGASGPEALRAEQFIDCSGESVAGTGGGIRDAARLVRRPLAAADVADVLRAPREGRPGGAIAARGLVRADHGQADLPMTSVWPDGPGGNAIKIKVPMFDATDTESLTAAEIQGRRRMMEVMDYHQRVENKPWRLDHCSPIIGIREEARIVGDYVLTVDDLRAGRAFDDGVARGTYYLDGHKPDDDQRTYILPKDQLAVPPYQIPLRSLIARDGRTYVRDVRRPILECGGLAPLSFLFGQFEIQSGAHATALQSVPAADQDLHES